jgi:plastocyanin
MSRQELVQQYLDGQLSRRVFIRRLIATGVTTAAALSYASVLEAVPAEARVGDFYLTVIDFYFTSNPANLAFGQRVEFANHSDFYQHTATDTTGMHLFNTGHIPRVGDAFVTIPSAGTYPYHCSETTHPPMKAQLRAPVVVTPSTGTSSTTFTIKWAAHTLPAGYVVDVQIQVPHGSTWASWKHGVTSRNATFRTSAKGTYSFRARLRRSSNGKSSGWSGAAHLTVH